MPFPSPNKLNYIYLYLQASFISRKSEGWQPRWSQDEDIVAIKTPNNEVGFYKGHQFDNPDKRLSVAKMDSFSLSPNAKNVVVFVPGQKGAPGFAKVTNFLFILQYPLIVADRLPEFGFLGIWNQPQNGFKAS